MRWIFALPLLFLLTACAGLGWEANPLIGRWTLTSAMAPGFTFGTYEFRRNSMTVLGVTQRVDYSVEGDRVLVVPEGPGIGVEVTVVDRNTARLSDPVTGGLLTLRRVDD
jgi:hypothetical protein